MKLATFFAELLLWSGQQGVDDRTAWTPRPIDTELEENSLNSPQPLAVSWLVDASHDRVRLRLTAPQESAGTPTV